MFFVKSLIQCLQSNQPRPGLLTEIFKTLTNVFPLIKEIYGSHWSEVFNTLETLWTTVGVSEESLPTIHSSLRLFAVLRSLAISDSNDDLEDAWIEAQKTHPPALVRLLADFGKNSGSRILDPAY